MDNSVREKAESWLNGNYDQVTKDQIRRLFEKNEEELVDSFYKDLEFGTGGLRGIMGVGSNRINKYTVGAATQGLANYLKISFPNEEIKVAIAYDCRNNSDFFAKVTAGVFAANGIKVYLFDSMRPTPELSFTIRHLDCKSGVVLTASHNPKEYNGYKAYWDDGSQIVAPHDKNIISEVNKIISVDEIKFEGKENLIEMVGEEIDKLYLDKVASLALAPEAVKRQHDLKIVFTPIHGTGIKLVPQALKQYGFTNVTIVEEQAEPDGNFPTVIYPNPEEAEALTLGLKKSQEIDADILLATDPDADRVGIAVKNHQGKFQLLNGNQTSTLYFNYLINAREEAHFTQDNDFIAKTIVTTELIDAIAKKHNIKCFNTLTGFKFIAAVIRENEGKLNYVGGSEESYGYMTGDFVRDKDGVSGVSVISEMAAYAKDKGMSLYDMLLDIYVAYGYYKEQLISIVKKGQSGAKLISQMMIDLRANPPKAINGSEVIEIRDYQTQKISNLQSGEVKKIDLPKSNVLQFYTTDGSKISARPSGTEPKIKFYFTVKEDLKNKSEYDNVTALLDQRIEDIIKDLKLKD